MKFSSSPSERDQARLGRHASVFFAACFSSLLALGCGEGLGFATASSLPTGPRRPDGVAVDPASAPPRATDVAGTEAGLLTLRTPLGAEAVLTTVSSFFQAVVVEDSDGLEALFSRDALAMNIAQNTGMGSPSATLFWAQRFRRLDYTKLAGELVYREAEIDLLRSEDMVEPTPHPSIRVEALGAGDVVVRIPIATARIGTERLLADEILMWLRRDGDRYRIYRIVEDFQLQ